MFSVVSPAQLHGNVLCAWFHQHCSAIITLLSEHTVLVNRCQSSLSQGVHYLGAHYSKHCILVVCNCLSTHAVHFSQGNGDCPFSAPIQPIASEALNTVS